VPVSPIDLLLAVSVSPFDLLLVVPVSPIAPLLAMSALPLTLLRALSVPPLALLLMIVVDELLDLLLVKPRLLEWLSSFAMRESHARHLLYVLLDYSASPVQSCQSRRCLIDGNIGP
jgi:hypothetical protein